MLCFRKLAIQQTLTFRSHDRELTVRIGFIRCFFQQGENIRATHTQLSSFPNWSTSSVVKACRLPTLSFPFELAKHLASQWYFTLSSVWVYLDVPACCKRSEHEHEAEAQDDDVEERLSFGTHVDGMVALSPPVTGHPSAQKKTQLVLYIKHCDSSLIQLMEDISGELDRMSSHKITGLPCGENTN